jgi:hypothetical protein
VILVIQDHKVSKDQQEPQERKVSKVFKDLKVILVIQDQRELQVHKDPKD